MSDNGMIGFNVLIENVSRMSARRITERSVFHCHYPSLPECSLLFSMIAYDSLRRAILVSFHWTYPIHYHVNPIPDLNDDEWYQEIPHH